jgi:hypothetical protein
MGLWRGCPRSIDALGAIGGPRMALGAVGMLGFCMTGDVLNVCALRGPLGAAGGGVPSLGGAISTRGALPS